MADPKKTYSNLMRMTEERMRELRHNMGVFLDKHDTLTAENESLEGQLHAERARLAELPDLRFAIANFEANVRTKQENNRNFMARIDDEVEQLREQIMEQFAEQKKYERLLEMHEEREQEKRERLEVLEVDERNLNKHQASNSA